jgi:lipoyl-dependent peroxiredoxin
MVLRYLTDSRNLEADKSSEESTMKIFYTAEATATGGRQGSVRSSDGNLDVTVVPPGTDQPGTNPEQLFAAGYSACFHSALQLIARRMKLDASESSVTARVGLGAVGDGAFGLSVELQVSLPHLDREQGEALVAKAHEVCPYSNATRGNIPVELTLLGTPAATVA